MNHSFDVDFATKYGVAEAILFNNLLFWCLHNKANEKSFFEGLYWTYNSISAYKELFPYLTDYSIKKALNHLEQEKIIKKGNHNDSSYDRTTWYAVTEYGYSIMRIQQMDDSKTTNQLGGNNKSTYTDINTDINPYNNKASKGKSDAFADFADGDSELLNLLNDFAEMRKKLKKPLTEKAKVLLVSKLQKNFSGRAEYIATLQQSILNSWQGVYPIKSNNAGYSAVVAANPDYTYGTEGVDHL